MLVIIYYPDWSITKSIFYSQAFDLYQFRETDASFDLTLGNVEAFIDINPVDINPWAYMLGVDHRF